MPLYEYKCPFGHKYEELAFSENAKPPCPTHHVAGARVTVYKVAVHGPIHSNTYSHAHGREIRTPAQLRKVEAMMEQRGLRRATDQEAAAVREERADTVAETRAKALQQGVSTDVIADQQHRAELTRNVMSATDIPRELRDGIVNSLTPIEAGPTSALSLKVS